jgi:hypothetical protein
MPSVNEAKAYKSYCNLASAAHHHACLFMYKKNLILATSTTSIIKQMEDRWMPWQ